MSLHLFCSMRRGFWAIGLLALAPYSYAFDDVIMIDQRAAMAGRITAGDAPGFPVTISQPGSYRLTGNLVIPDGASTAVTITADNVTLDLNGFSILGPNVCNPNPTVCTFRGAEIGILAVNDSGGPHPASVRIKNGSVKGMGGHGMRIMGDGAVVEKVHAMMNGGPGIVATQGAVIDSVVRLSGGGGSALVGFIVRGNISTQNSNIGISVQQGGVASENIASYNDGSGMRAYYATVTGNTVNNNGSFGIESICPGVLIGNTATQNRNANIATNAACTMANNAQ